MAHNGLLDLMHANKICRVCLSKKDNMKPLFGGAEANLAEMLMSCASLQVREDDKLPGEVCNHCYYILKRSHRFKKLCEQSDKVLRQLLDISKESEMIVVKAECNSDYEDNENDNDFPPNLPQQCNEAPPVLEKQKPLTVPKVVKPKPKKVVAKRRTFFGERKKFQCKICRKYFSKLATFKLHKLTHENMPRIAVVAKKPTPVHIAPIQIAPVQIAPPRTEYNGAVSRPQFPCIECGKSFNDKEKLRSHQGYACGYRCEVCGNLYKRKGELTKHQKEHFSYKCEICLQAFNAPHDVIRHKVKHRNEEVARRNPPKLDLQVDMPEIKKPNVHPPVLSMETDDGEDKIRFPCEICGKRLTRQYDLVVHMRIHTGERPFECEHCDKNYRSSASLVRHEIAEHNRPPNKKKRLQ